MKDNKKEIWRYIVAGIAIAYIIYMWIEKDIASIYLSVPKEQALPLIVTSTVVSLLKVGVIAGVILLGKWLFGKIRK